MNPWPLLAPGAALRRTFKSMRSAGPARFRLRFARETNRADVEAYHDAAVMAEMWLSRIQAALEAGVMPINSRHGRASDLRWSRRPGFHAHPLNSAEHLRWYTARGVSRSTPLTQETLTLELMAVHGWDLQHATVLVQQSDALLQRDQAWLMARAASPIERRPLNDTEYRQLARVLDHLHAIPPGLPDLAPNVERVEGVAQQLGGWLDDYHLSPFRSHRLTAVFNQAHRQHLDRRAAWAARRLALVSARHAPSLHQQARVTADLTRFQAQLARRKGQAPPRAAGVV